ncbi:hypothetical protein ACIPUC_00555 [Streptomyces sp. LARHCF249]
MQPPVPALCARFSAPDHVTLDERDLLVDPHAVTAWTSTACSTS